MNLHKKIFWKGCFVFVLVAVALLTNTYQIPVFGGVKPGTYDVTIYSGLGDYVMEDTWIFSKNGKFESKEFRIESEWEDTGDDTFKIKTDKQEIKDVLEEGYKSIGLNNSDVSINIRKVRFSGTSSGNKIEGSIETSYIITLKKPIKITLSTRGSVDFDGSRK